MGERREGGDGMMALRCGCCVGETRLAAGLCAAEVLRGGQVAVVWRNFWQP